MSASEIQLVYDRQCPVCDAYCRALDREGSLPGLELVDARSRTAVLEEITSRGWDIDEGMVLKVDGELHYGADAIHELAVLRRGAGAFGWGNRWLFGSLRRARLLYPLLRTGRGLLLKLLGRSRVNNLKLPGRERF